MEFSEKIKDVRSQLGVSQEKLAKLLDVSFSTVNRWEQGKAMPNYRTVQKLIAVCKERNIRFES